MSERTYIPEEKREYEKMYEATTGGSMIDRPKKNHYGLLPCPFCRSEARTVQIGGNGVPVEWYATCENRVCGVETMLYDTEKEAINVWNRRAE